jgi:hypothetical protein
MKDNQAKIPDLHLLHYNSKGTFGGDTMIQYVSPLLY